MKWFPILILLGFSTNANAIHIQQGSIELGDIIETEPGWLKASEISRIYHLPYSEDRVGQYISFFSNECEIVVDHLQKTALACDELRKVSDIRYTSQGDLLFPLDWVIDTLSRLANIQASLDSTRSILRIGEVPYNINRLDMIRKTKATIISFWFTDSLTVTVTLDSLKNELFIVIPQGKINPADVSEERRFGLVEEIKLIPNEDTTLIKIILGNELEELSETYTANGYDLTLIPKDEKATPEELAEERESMRGLKQIEIEQESTEIDTDITDSQAIVETLAVEIPLLDSLAAESDTFIPEYNHPFVDRPIKRIVLVTTDGQGATNELYGLSEYEFMENFIEKLSKNLSSIGYIVTALRFNEVDAQVVRRNHGDLVLVLCLGSSYIPTDYGVRIYYPSLPGGKDATFRMDLQNYERSLIAERVLERAGGLYLVNVSRGGIALRHKNIRLANKMMDALSKVCNGQPLVYEYDWLLFYQMTSPVVAMELGLVTNETEVDLLMSSDYQAKLAQAIAQGVVAFTRKD